MVPNWCSFLSQLANLFFWYYSLVMASIPKRAGSTSRHGWVWKGPLRWRARGLGTWRYSSSVRTNKCGASSHSHKLKSMEDESTRNYKLNKSDNNMQEDDDSNDPSRRAMRKWRFGMDKGCQGWFQGHPIMVPLYGKFPVLYGNSMENLPNKGVPLLGVPDNPTELESQECCWSTLDLAKIHPC